METKTAVSAASTSLPNWLLSIQKHAHSIDEELDYLTQDAALLFDVPFAMINLIVDNKIIFKSCVGEQQGQSIERKGAFCSFAIKCNNPTYVRDTINDARFRKYRLVTDSPGVRSYLGIPLKASDDTIIGTFCIMDTKPRKYAKHQLNLLEVMANKATTQLLEQHR